MYLSCKPICSWGATYVEYFVQACNGKAITIVLCKGNLLKIDFTKAYGADVTNLVQFLTGDGVFEFFCTVLWPFECEGYSYASKYGEWHNIEIFSCSTSSLLCKVCIEKNNIGMQF